MNTSFSLLTYGWLDDSDDFPLKYQIFFYTTDPNLWTIAKSLSIAPYTSTLLSQGRSGDHLGTLVAWAYDYYGCGASPPSAAAVVVVEALQDTAALAALVTTQLTRALQTKNPTKTSLIISLAAASLNSVDCVYAPDCTALRRRPCSSVINTCGECISGSVGAVGASNTPCFSTTAPTGSSAARLMSAVSDLSAKLWDKINVSSMQNVLQHSSYSSSSDERQNRRKNRNLMGLGSERCTSQSDCLSGKCDIVPVSNKSKRGTCTPAVKKCPSDCSGNGVCVSYDQNWNRLTDDSVCLIQDAFCYSACSCNKGFYGSMVLIHVAILFHFSSL